MIKNKVMIMIFMMTNLRVGHKALLCSLLVLLDVDHLTRGVHHLEEPPGSAHGERADLKEPSSQLGIHKEPGE